MSTADEEVVGGSFQSDEAVVGGSTVSDSEDAGESKEEINYLCCACQRTYKDPLIFTKIYQFWLPEPGNDDWSCPPCTAAIFNKHRLWGCHPGWGPTPQGAAPWEGAAGRRAWLESQGPHRAVSASHWLGPEPPPEGVPSQPTTQTETITETEPETITEIETLWDNEEDM